MHSKISIRCLAAALVFMISANGESQRAHALPPCTDTAISNTGAGVISMRTGQNFKVYPGTGGKVWAWLPGDKVTVCPLGGSAYEITNLDRKNQAVKALRG